MIMLAFAWLFLLMAAARKGAAMHLSQRAFAGKMYKRLFLRRQSLWGFKESARRRPGLKRALWLNLPAKISTFI